MCPPLSESGQIRYEVGTSTAWIARYVRGVCDWTSSYNQPLRRKLRYSIRQIAAVPKMVVG